MCPRSAPASRLAQKGVRQRRQLKGAALTSRPLRPASVRLALKPTGHKKFRSWSLGSMWPVLVTSSEPNCTPPLGDMARRCLNRSCSRFASSCARALAAGLAAGLDGWPAEKCAGRGGASAGAILRGTSGGGLALRGGESEEGRGGSPALAPASAGARRLRRLRRYSKTSSRKL
jgi:hypothetical protein